MRTPETHCGVKLADPESLLGMLQRGRGRGYLAALASAPETVWPLLLECVTHDPRIDTDCETRADYYASLILATEMDLEPLRSHLKTEDCEENNCGLSQCLPLATLACLAERSDRALQILREYVSFGREWPWVVRVLGDLDRPGALDGIDETLCRLIRRDESTRAQFRSSVEEAWRGYCGFTEEQRTDCELLLPLCEPWKSLCRVNVDLENLFAELGIPYQQSPPGPYRERIAETDLADLSVEELFGSVDRFSFSAGERVLANKVSGEHGDYLLKELSSENKYRVMLALRGLGHRGTPKAFEVIRSYIETSENADPKVRRQAFFAMADLPAHLTLETARIWFRREEWFLQVAAGDVLENHATLDDVPLLTEALRTPETIRCEDFRLASALNALARFEGIGPIEELEHIFCAVGQCYHRHRAAVAMESTSFVHFGHYYAFECLWDCHDDTRELGCDAVPLSIPGALDRVRELAEDTDECDDVRRAAQRALDEF